MPGPTAIDDRTRPGGQTLPSTEAQPPPDEAAVSTPGGALSRLWERLAALPTWCFVAWVAALLVVRSGVSWSGFDELVTFARDFPHPGPTFRSNAVLGPTLAWATQMHSPDRWVALHAIVTLGWFVATAWLLRRAVGSARRWRVALVWLAFVSTPTSLLRHLGSYDVYTLWGAVLIALGGTPATALLGGALLGATNAEQGLLAIVCGAAVHWALTATSDPEPDPTGAPRQSRSIAAVFGPAIAGLVLGRLAVLIWFARLDATVQGRSGAFGQLLQDSLTNAVSLGGTGAYSWLAAGWVVVAGVLWHLRTHPARWLVAALGLIVVPAAATVTTLDGSRVFCAVSSVAVLLAMVRLTERVDRPDGEWMLRGAALLMVAGILLPALNTTYRGGIRIPWRFFLV